MILTIDTETTGLVPGTDAVVELAGVCGDRSFSSLVAPGRRIAGEASAVHHIRDADVRDAPHLPQAVDAMLRGVGLRRSDVLAGTPVVMQQTFTVAAHNAPFDLGFLAGLLPDSGYVCTWKCARHLWPDSPSFSNQALRYTLGLDAECRAALSGVPLLVPHRALYDALVTSVLLRHMLKQRTEAELVHLSTQPVLQRVCRFGAKHRGQLWADVPKSYLRWMLTLGDLDADTKHTAEHWSS